MHGLTDRDRLTIGILLRVGCVSWLGWLVDVGGRFSDLSSFLRSGVGDLKSENLFKTQKKYDGDGFRLITIALNCFPGHVSEHRGHNLFNEKSNDEN